MTTAVAGNSLIYVSWIAPPCQVHEILQPSDFRKSQANKTEFVYDCMQVLFLVLFLVQNFVFVCKIQGILVENNVQQHELNVISWSATDAHKHIRKKYPYSKRKLKVYLLHDLNWDLSSSAISKRLLFLKSGGRPKTEIKLIQINTYDTGLIFILI